MATKNKGQRPSEKAQPSTSSTRLEKSRKLAQKRRETYKDLMTGIMESLPFSRDVLTQLDYNSRLRLGLCFLKMKNLLEQQEGDSPKMIEAPPPCTSTSTSTSSSTGASNAVVFQPGILQELMIEAMDGFLMVLLSDGNIVYLSESIQKHMGLFQSEHMGTSLYDLVLEEDHTNVKMALSSAEIKAHTKIGTKRVSVPCSFFCRMRCSRNKVANTQSKSPGYKVVHTSGYFRLHGSEAFLVALVKPVTPPSILEIRMEGNMFVTHYTLDMRCSFFDGRLNYLMGYRKDDLIGKLAFDFHHHDDTEATLECSRGVQARGEGMSGYYRMITKHGEFVWLQSRATMMFDSHTGKPSYLVCMNFIINKEKGNQSLEAKKALPAPPVDTKAGNFISEENSKAHDPFPIPREDGKHVNPLSVDPGDEPSPTDSSSVAGGKTGKVVSVKMEEESPPELPPLPDTEEPTSTTSPRPSSGRVSSSDVSSCTEVGGRDHNTDHTPNECVPDSTSTGEASPEYGMNRVTESGYNSRGDSTSSYSALPKKPPPDSDSSGSSSDASPSVIFIRETSHNEVFSGSSSVTGVSPVQSYAGSSSTVLESDSSVYQDPVIQEVPTTGGDSESRRSSCRHQSTGGVSAQNVSMPPHKNQLPQKAVHGGRVQPGQMNPLGSIGGQQQPLSHQSGQQQQPQQPIVYQSGQQQPIVYQSGQQQPIVYQSGQQQQPQQPIVYQSGQQQPIAYQSGQQQQPQQPIVYQSGQQQPIVYQSGQQQPIAYQSGQQQPTVYQSGQQQQPQQPIVYQSGQQQPTVYQSGQQQQPQQPIVYQSGQQQPIVYQSGQQQQIVYQSSQQQMPQQPLVYQPQQPQAGYQVPLSHLGNHTHSVISQPQTGYISQQPALKQEATSLQYSAQPSCRYSNPTQTGTGTQWQGNGIGTQQYQYQSQQQSYQLHHENSASFTASGVGISSQQPQQPVQNHGGFPPVQQMAPPPSHTHQMTSSQFQTQQEQNYQNLGFQPPPKSNPPNQPPLMSGGLNPQSLPLFSSLGQSNTTPTTGQQMPLTQRGVSLGASAVAGESFIRAPSVPLTHQQGFQAPQTTGAAGMAGNVGHLTGQVTSHVTPDLVNLTGEDLQILDFIDQLGTGSGGGLAQPVPSSHLHAK